MTWVSLPDNITCLLRASLYCDAIKLISFSPFGPISVPGRSAGARAGSEHSIKRLLYALRCPGSFFVLVRGILYSILLFLRPSIDTVVAQPVQEGVPR